MVDLLSQTMMFRFPMDLLLFSTGSKMATCADRQALCLSRFCELVACLFQVFWLDALRCLGTRTVHNDNKVESNLI